MAGGGAGDRPLRHLDSTACQNMAAILNDPKKGKQKDFFTRTWGESFAERPNILPSSLLPEITQDDFTPYLRKLSHRLAGEAGAQTVQSPNLKAAKSIERSQRAMDSIPKTLLSDDFDLSRPETFHEVFPFITARSVSSTPPGCRQVLASGKQLQEKLSQHLDVVEMQIAHQIAHKSDAFFRAVASHDSVREEIATALHAVQQLRRRVHHLDHSVTLDSLQVVQRVAARRNRTAVRRKLELMATVHQTQPTIQLLLATSDFVAALDLIATTQEVVQQELASIHCFRHLGSQLAEMENVIEKMLATEFERLTTAELNRPLPPPTPPTPPTPPAVAAAAAAATLLQEEDRLTAVVSGMLRQRRYNFVQLFKDEALTAVRALVKQATGEALAASDVDVSDRAPDTQLDRLSQLPLAAWIRLMRQCTFQVTSLLVRVRAIHDLMEAVLTASTTAPGDGDASTVPDEDGQRVRASLAEMLQSVGDAGHEQCGRLLSTRTKDGALLERLSSTEFVTLARLVDAFVDDCQPLTGHRATALRLVFQGQATRFVKKFHEERRSKLAAVLDGERWRQVGDVPADVQAAVQRFLAADADAHGPATPTTAAEDPPTEVKEFGATLWVGDEAFAAVGAAVFLVRQLLEYCGCVGDLPAAAPDLLTRLVELVKTFNSRTCQLVLGAGALPLVGLKTISSRNLALASRSLQLVTRFIPPLKRHFHSRLPDRHKTMVKHLDQALKDYNDHIAEIENKLVALLSDMVQSHLSTWEIKPPVPSQAFRAICKQMVKLHEAVAGVWPAADVQRFYDHVNRVFKDELRAQIARLGVRDDGGPQHGLVTSELVFYVQNLKSLKVLDDDETVERFSVDLWQPR